MSIVVLIAIILLLQNEASAGFKKVDVISSKDFENQVQSSDSYRKPLVQEEFPSFYVEKDKDGSKGDTKSQKRTSQTIPKTTKKTDAIAINKATGGTKSRSTKTRDRVEARFYPLPDKSQSNDKKVNL